MKAEREAGHREVGAAVERLGEERRRQGLPGEHQRLQALHPRAREERREGARGRLAFSTATEAWQTKCELKRSARASLLFKVYVCAPGRA